MTMKYFKISLLFALVAMLTACGGDDEPSGTPDDYRMGFITDYDVNLRVKVTDPDAVKDIATLTVRYYDQAGNMQKEIVTGAEWNKNVKYTVGDNLKIGLCAEWTLRTKEEIQAAPKTAYDLGVDITSLYIGTKTNGDKVESTFFSKQNVGISGGAKNKESLIALKESGKRIYSSFLFIYKKLSNGGIYAEESNFPEE